jgi:exodeoxyribonuclease V alpha subunit
MARARTRSDQQGDKLKGELIEFTIRGSEMWGVGKLRTLNNGGDVEITGKMLGAKIGDTLEVTGWASVHPRYGKQFKVTSVEVIVPQDAAGVVSWLASNLPQVSRRRAEQLVAKHGIKGVWAILDERRVGELVAIDGITAARAEEIFAAYDAAKLDRDRMVQLKGWGLTDNQINRVLMAWGKDAIEHLQANPYELMEVVDGFGWAKTDVVAQRMGVPKDSLARLCAGLMHLIEEASQSKGHCYIPQGALVKVCARDTCGVDESLVRQALEHVLKSGKLVRRGTGIYAPGLDEAEQSLSDAIAARVKAQRSV